MTGRPARRSLAAAFQPQQAQPIPDRAAALSGLLPPRPQQPAADAAGLSLVEPAGERPEPEGDDSGRAAPAPTSVQGARRSADDVVRGVVVYVPVEVLERLRATARSRQLTYSDLLVESAVHLPEIAGLFAGPEHASQASASAMPARAVRRAVQPGVQVQLRLDGHQVRWIDEQVHRLSAPSRTALVVALLRAHLGVE